MKKEGKLRQDISLILSSLDLGDNSKLEAVILYGSYGRGEGAFYSVGEETFTYNDYDILLIVSELIDDKKISEYKDLVSSKTDIKWIDLSQMLKSDLEDLKPTIFNYDLKYGSEIIWGDESILKYIRIQKSAQIQYQEIEILFFTRLYTFIASLDASGFQVGVKGEDARFFRYQMAKAVLAAVDCELILAGKYSHSYKEKVSLISGYMPELKALSEWALREKLCPSAPKMTTNQVVDLYKAVTRTFHKSMLKGLSRLYKRKIDSTQRHIDCFNLSSKNFYAFLRTFLRRKVYSKFLEYHRISFAQAFIVEHYLSQNTSKDYMLSYVRKQIKNYSNKNLKLEKNFSWNAHRVGLSELLKQSR